MQTRFGWLLTIALCGIAPFVPSLFAQQDSLRPKKILTPEQQAYQQERVAYQAKRESIQAQAALVFRAEMAREQAGDCPDAASTYDSNVCFGKQLAITDENLKSYEGFIHDLQTPPPPIPGVPALNSPGPAGPSLSSQELAAEFDRVEQSWRQYRETACTAAFHQFEGGTGGPGFEMQCELKLKRDHMRELDAIYFMVLHK